MSSTSSVSSREAVSLCDKRLTITTLKGETLLDRAYGNLHLHDYALDGDDFCALLLGRYQAGNICTLTTYGLDGQELAKTPSWVSRVTASRLRPSSVTTASLM